MATTLTAGVEVAFPTEPDHVLDGPSLRGETHQQAQPLLDRGLLCLGTGCLDGLGDQGVVDVDVGAHAASMCIGRQEYTHNAVFAQANILGVDRSVRTHDGSRGTTP